MIKLVIFPRRALVLPVGKNLARKFVEQSAHIVFFSFVA